MTRILRALACAPLLFAVPAWAGPDQTDIVVTANLPKDSPPAPGGSDSVAAGDFADRAAVSLKDALAFSPGVYLQPRFGQEVRLSIRGSGLSRGFHMRGITLLQDGVPINLADDNGDFQELDPTLLDRIDVYRGANALRYGASTLGGAIDGVTPTGRTRPGLALRLDGGSFATVRGLVSYGGARGAGDAFLALAADRSAGDRDHASREALRFNGNVGLRLSPGIETRFYASAQTIRQDLPGALTRAVALTAPKTGNFAGDQERDVDSLRIQNRTRIALGGGALTLGGFLNAKELFHPIYQVVDQVSTDWGSFARCESGEGPLSVSAGVTARFGTVRSQRFVNIGGDRGARTFLARQRARTIDLYGEARWKPIEPLTLIAGLVHTDGSRRQDTLFPAPALGRATFAQTSPKLGLLFDPAPGVQFYANYNRSHELPGFIELAQIAAFVPVAAQRAWTAEAGVRGAIGPARFDIAAYRSDLRGELLQYSVSPTIPASTFNADRTRHQGIEASLDLALTRWATLRQAYTYSDFALSGDAVYGDNRLPVIPRHVWRGELRLGPKGWHVAPVVEWVPQGAFADYRDTVRVPGYALIGASAAVDAGRATFFLDLRNATAKRAIGDISATILATPASAIYYPVERRAIYAGVRAGF